MTALLVEMCLLWFRAVCEVRQVSYGPFFALLGTLPHKWSPHTHAFQSPSAIGVTLATGITLATVVVREMFVLQGCILG